MAETTPVEEMPLGMFIAWLSVFLAVVLFGVALPVIDVRWVVPFVVFAAVLFTGEQRYDHRVDRHAAVWRETGGMGAVHFAARLPARSY